MNNINVTLASLQSILINPQKNLERVKAVCINAKENNSRLILLPELMLTGHGGHKQMLENAESIPSGELSKSILKMSEDYQLCIVVGIAELANNIVYNSQIVMDKGKFLGLQRKIYLSQDEYCYFGTGNKIEVFDIGEIKFGISICYDNLFPEFALIHNLNNVDVILAPHAARTGIWPYKLTQEFCIQKIKECQEHWEKIHRTRAYDHNVYILLCNAVGSSTEGLENVIANHAGTIMAIDPDGEVFARTSKTDFTDEIVTIKLEANKRKINHPPSRNRCFTTLIELLQKR